MLLEQMRVTRMIKSLSVFNSQYQLMVDVFNIPENYHDCFL
jgi:hypothetical protein